MPVTTASATAIDRLVHAADDEELLSARDCWSINEEGRLVASVEVRLRTGEGRFERRVGDRSNRI